MQPPGLSPDVFHPRLTEPPGACGTQASQLSISNEYEFQPGSAGSGTLLSTESGHVESQKLSCGCVPWNIDGVVQPACWRASSHGYTIDMSK